MRDLRPTRRVREVGGLDLLGVDECLAVEAKPPPLRWQWGPPSLPRLERGTATAAGYHTARSCLRLARHGEPLGRSNRGNKMAGRQCLASCLLGELSELVFAHRQVERHAVQRRDACTTKQNTNAQNKTKQNKWAARRCVLLVDLKKHDLRSPCKDTRTRGHQDTRLPLQGHPVEREDYHGECYRGTMLHSTSAAYIHSDIDICVVRVGR